MKQNLLPSDFTLAQRVLGISCLSVGSLVAVVLGLTVVELSYEVWRPPVPPAQAIGAPDREVAPPTQPSEFTRRLDGVLVVTKEEADARPLAVMIENLTTVRPQFGLGSARVVYETLAEGGITRFMALYLPDAGAKKIGPVRSARHYYVDWVEEYGAAYAHAGGSPQGLGQIVRDRVADVNGIGNAWRYFWRDPAYPAPHNLFTNSEQLGMAVIDLQYSSTATFDPWRFADGHSLVDRERTASSVDIGFSSASYAVQYNYDPLTNSYRRSNGGVPQLDKLSGEQIRADNVVVQFVKKPVSLGAKGRIDLETEGEGKATVFRNGGMAEGIWRKTGVSSRTTFVDSAGNDIFLNRGVTWVEVVPEDRPVTYR